MSGYIIGLKIILHDNDQHLKYISFCTLLHLLLGENSLMETSISNYIGFCTQLNLLLGGNIVMETSISNYIGFCTLFHLLLGGNIVMESSISNYIGFCTVSLTPRRNIVTDFLEYIIKITSHFLIFTTHFFQYQILFFPLP